MTAPSQFVPTGLREIDRLQKQLIEMRQVIDTALPILKAQLLEVIAELPARIDELERIIKPLLVPTEADVELRALDTDGIWRVVQASDAPRLILAGRQVKQWQVKP